MKQLIKNFKILSALLLMSTFLNVQLAKAQCATCPSNVVNVTTGSPWTTSQTVSNQCIIVSGSLTILPGTNILFINCVFKMAPGSSIIVGDGLTTSAAAILRLRTCCVGGTTGLWNGIDVLHKSQILVELNSTIRDAIVGVTMHPNYGTPFTSLGNFRDSKFIDNITGIATPNLGNTNLGFMTFILRNMEFYGSGNALLGNPGTFATNGIMMSNMMNVNITSAAAANKFHTLNGIGAGFYNTANAIVNNCLFEDIENTAIESNNMLNPLNLNGTVYGSLQVYGFGMASASTSIIKNCRGGISANQVATNITNSKIEANTLGIQVYAATNALHVIKNNRILVNSSTMSVSPGVGQHGIKMKENAPYATGSTIKENYLDLFSLFGNSGYGQSTIDIGEFNNNIGDFSIEGNNVNMKHGYHGINIFGLEGIIVKGNSIFVRPITGSTALLIAQGGINLDNVNESKISCNWIYADNYAGNQVGTTVVSPVGIKVLESVTNLYQGNRLGYQHNVGTNALPTGMHFDQDCSNSIITGNEFYPLVNHGLIYGGNNAITGTQTDQGNRWWGTGSFSAKHFGPQPVYSVSQYIVSLTDPVEYRPVPPAVFPASGWFFYTGITGQQAVYDADINCHIPPPPQMAVGYHGGFNEANFEQTYGLDPVAEFPATIGWQSSKNVYQQFSDDASLRNSDVDYAAFFNSNNNSSIRYFGELERLMPQIYPEYDASIALLMADNVVLSETLASIDSTYSDVDSLNDSTYFANFINSRTVLESQILANVQTIQSKTLANYANKESLRNQASALIATLSEDDLLQWNEKVINNIILQTIAIRKYSFTEQQKSDIETVAQQCPLAGGKIVMMARNLWDLYDNSMKEYNDVADCAAQGYAMRHSNNLLNEMEELTIFPNPASDLLHITGLGKNASLHIIISDILGHGVMNQDFATIDNNLAIPVSDIPAGVYLIEITLNDGTRKQSKLSIIR